MEKAMIARVRRFNRTVTQRVGALDEQYLARDRPLGEARLLWEIGPDGCDVRSLRSRLELDSGYLSRLLRALEQAGLVSVAPSPRDRRVRTARLTRAGSAERRLLDRRSDALATSLLAPLAAEERQRLLAAMGEVERLLSAALLEIAAMDPDRPDARHCLAAYFTEIDGRFAAGFDPTKTVPVDAFRPPEGRFLVASLRGEPIGCGALMFHRRATADIKRMWVSPEVRGLGIGRRLLAELESRAVRHGARVVRLETNRVLAEAIALYRSSGYVEVPAFNDEPYAHHWFEKRMAR